MAGATNRAMKAAGVPKATIVTLRVEHGGHLSLRSAISIAHERGLDTGKAHEFMAKRDAKKAAAPAAQAATADFRSKAAATMKAAGERTAKEGRAAVLAARLRDRAANALGTNRGDIANARADRILKANPGARGLAEQLRGERRFETKSAVNQTMRLGQVSRSNFNLPATRSERVAGLLSSMKAKEAQSAARRADMKKAQQAAAPTDAKKRRSATDFYAPPSRGPSKREKQAIRDARDVILGPRKAAASPAPSFNKSRNADRRATLRAKVQDRAAALGEKVSALRSALATAEAGRSKQYATSEPQWGDIRGKNRQDREKKFDRAKREWNRPTRRARKIAALVASGQKKVNRLLASEARLTGAIKRVRGE